MTEGELYKKIIKKRCVNYLANKSVKAVIDEAKKDIQLGDYIIIEKAKWIKWFGDLE